MDYLDIPRLNKELRKITSSKEQTHIDLLLNSWGGNAHTAYKAALLLRSKCSSLNVVVPYFAKSAATLLCLGADNVFMNGTSELGPLDAQLEHPHAQGIWISAKDEVSALDYLQFIAESWAVDSAITRIAPQIARSQKSRDSLELALKYVADVIRPVMEQIDPLIINMSYRNLEMTQRYARDLLTRFMLRGTENVEKVAEETAYKLVNGYQEHGYVIGIDEARSLNLKVQEMSSLPNYEALMEHYLSWDEGDMAQIKLITEEILGTNQPKQNTERDSSEQASAD